MTDLLVEHISFAYGNTQILKDVSFTAKSGELTCLIGPSGCGKTTLLRLIAGLEPIQQGHIKMGNEALNLVPARKRRIGFVFQQPSLFPHLSVRDNITFGIRDISKSEQIARSDELLEMIELKDLAGRFPHQLSGGQQQRVSLARALAPKPRLMLLDEPFAHLDHDLLAHMHEHVVNILKSSHIPTIMVTHDPNEADTTADKIVKLKAQTA